MISVVDGTVPEALFFSDICNSLGTVGVPTYSKPSVPVSYRYLSYAVRPLHFKNTGLFDTNSFFFRS